MTSFLFMSRVYFVFSGKTSVSVPSEVSQIQTEIMTNGPVEAAFTVYADFPSYKKGTQRHRLTIHLHIEKVSWIKPETTDIYKPTTSIDRLENEIENGHISEFNKVS